MTNRNDSASDVAAIEAVVHAWEKALAEHGAEALLACYAPDAVLESPVAAHILGGAGVCRGHDELIAAHRVYWGWRGIQILINDQYHRS